MADQGSDPLDYAVKRILWHFGEVVEPEIVARVKSYIEPTVKKLANIKPVKIAPVRAKFYVYQPILRTRAKYQLELPSKRYGCMKRKKLDKLARVR